MLLFSDLRFYYNAFALQTDRQTNIMTTPNFEFRLDYLDRYDASCTSEQVGLVSKSGVDCCIHGARSVIINTADICWIVGTVQSIVCYPP